MLIPFGEIDPEQIKMNHAARHLEEVEFFNGLSEMQLVFMTKILGTIAHSEESAEMAQRYVGNAEAYLAMRFHMCACGTKHDPSAELKEMLHPGTSESASESPEPASEDS